MTAASSEDASQLREASSAAIEAPVAHEKITGRERLYNAPGEGVVAKQVGRLVIHVAADGTVTTLFQAGRWDESVFPAVCAYLEG